MIDVDIAKIFTDGSSRGNPGPGGWAAIVSYDGKITEIGGHEKSTTNNRMEITAVIKALELLKSITKNYKPEAVVHTDSAYVLNGSTKWLWGWKRNNWKTQTKGDVLNKDLWLQMEILLAAIKVEWKLVSGHVGVPANERCDEIATSFADKKVTPLYKGDEKEYPVDLSVTVGEVSSVEKKSKKTGKAHSYVSAINGEVRIHQSWGDCEARVKGKKGARFKKVFSQGEESELVEEWRK